MNNESPMHKAFTSYMHDCGCNKSTTQLSNNEEDDILVLPTDEPGLDVTVLSNDIVTNLGYKGYVPIYFQPHSVFEALKQSMEEESVAIDWYIRRQIYSKDNNDEKSAKLWGEIAGDEEEHYIQFGKRILETSGKDALSGVMADMPFRIPITKESVMSSGIESGDDITAFTGSYPGKKHENISDLTGRYITMPGFGSQKFSLHYAGWDDWWIARNTKGEDMGRFSGKEIISSGFLIPK